MSNVNLSRGGSSDPIDAIEIGSCPRGEKDDSRLSADEDIVEWDSPADPQNPRNWPEWKKSLHIFLLGILTLNA